MGVSPTLQVEQASMLVRVSSGRVSASGGSGSDGQKLVLRNLQVGCRSRGTCLAVEQQGCAVALAGTTACIAAESIKSF